MQTPVRRKTRRQADVSEKQDICAPPRVDILPRLVYIETVKKISQEDNIMQNFASILDGIADFFSAIFMSILVFFNGGKLF